MCGILLKLPSHILNKVYNTDILHFFPMKNQKRGNRINCSKYCRFHQDYGHHTKESIYLKDEIEELIQWGKLSYYVKKEERHYEAGYQNDKRSNKCHPRWDEQPKERLDKRPLQ